MTQSLILKMPILICRISIVEMSKIFTYKTRSKKCYDLTWFDLKGDSWDTSEHKDYEAFELREYGYKNTLEWISSKCINRDAFFSDDEMNLYHRYYKILDKYRVVLVKKRNFYEIVNPNF